MAEQPQDPASAPLPDVAASAPAAVDTPNAAPSPSDDAPKRKLNLQVFGTSGLQESGGYILQEKHPRLRGRLASLMYEEMALNSPTVHAVMHAMKTWLTAPDWRVEPAMEHNPDAEFWAEFVEQCVDDMAHTFEDFLREGLSMLDYGWSAAEICFKRRLGSSDDPTCNSKHNDGYIGWRKLSYRSQLTMDHWWFDEDQGLRGFFQRPPIGGFSLGQHGKYLGIYQIPIEKLLLFRTSTENANPEGRSMLRGAVNSYLRIRRFEDLQSIGIERDLVGYPILEVPEDLLDAEAPPEVQQKAMAYFEMLCNMKRGDLEGLMIPSSRTPDDKPSGWKFSLASTGGTRTFDIDKTVQRHEDNIAKSMLAEFITVGVGKSGGSLALHSDKTDGFALSLRSILQRMAAVINRFGVRQLCLINGCPPDLIPTLKHGDVSAPPFSEVAAAVSQLAAAGMLMYDVKVERKLREMGDLPEMDDDTPSTPPVPRTAPDPGDDAANANGQTHEQEADASGLGEEINTVLPSDTDVNLPAAGANT